MLSHAHPELHDSKYVVFIDSSRRYLDCSPAVLDLLGYSRREMLNKTIEDVSYEAEITKLFEEYLRQGSQQGDFVLRHKSGAPVPIRYQAFVFPDGCKAAMWEPIDDWRQLYFAALLEFDPAKLKRRIDAALDAIHRQLSDPNTTPTDADKRLINDALSALKALQQKI